MACISYGRGCSSWNQLAGNLHYLASDNWGESRHVLAGVQANVPKGYSSATQELSNKEVKMQGIRFTGKKFIVRKNYVE